MSATKTDRFPLDGLLQCGECGAMLRLEPGSDPCYFCPGSGGRAASCGVPALDAWELNWLLTAEITGKVITAATAPQFRARLGQALAGEAGPDADLTPDLTGDLTDDLTEEGIRVMAAEALWLRGREGTAAPAAMLGSFVEGIEVRAGAATVRYLMPLPPGTPLAGATRQTVSLPGTIRWTTLGRGPGAAPAAPS